MKHKIGSALQNGYALPQKTIRYVLIFPAGIQVYLSNKRRETGHLSRRLCVQVYITDNNNQ